MSSENPQHQQASHSKTAKLPEVAAMENYVRLQQSQEEYLNWLESCEKKPEIDQYTYRKIR